MDNFLLASLILFVSATFAAVASRWLNLPPVLGYIAAGIVLGSSVTGLIEGGSNLELLAEIGVILLLFTVGLEFSLTEFWADRHRVLSAGALQMSLFGLPVGLCVWSLGYGVEVAVLLAGATAMSSTALTAKQLVDQGEVTTRHGRGAITVLIFQDMAAIPLLSMLAIWQIGADPSPLELAGELASILLLFTVALLIARPVLHRVLALVYRIGSSEAFLFAALSLIVMAALAAHALGASAALGAFLAGLVLGESDVRHRIESDVRPFRDLFSSIFFVTVGLQIEIRQIISTPIATAAWLTALVPAKIITNFAALRIATLSQRDAFRTGLILGHGGEFGLLLTTSALASGFVSATLGQPLLAALAISMSVAPMLIRANGKISAIIAEQVQQGLIPAQQEEIEASAHTSEMDDHVIVCGAGVIGKSLSMALVEAKVPHIVIEADLPSYLDAKEAGLPVILGDASRIPTLRAAGAHHARQLIVTMTNINLIERILAWYLIENDKGSIKLCIGRENPPSEWARNSRIYIIDPRFRAALDAVRAVLLDCQIEEDYAEEILNHLSQRYDELRDTQ